VWTGSKPSSCRTSRELGSLGKPSYAKSSRTVSLLYLAESLAKETAKKEKTKTDQAVAC
jgi:hypothetical protein